MSKTFIQILAVNGSEFFVNLERVAVFEIIGGFEDGIRLYYSAQEDDYDYIYASDRERTCECGVRIPLEELEMLKVTIREFVKGEEIYDAGK